MRLTVPALLTVAVLAVTTRPALADPPSMTLPTEPPPPQPQPHKSESTARALAVAGTLAGPLLMMIGSRVSSSHHDAGTDLVYAGAVVAVLAPSAGHWYAGKILTPGLGLRVAGAGAAALGVVVLIACGIDRSPGHCGSTAGAGLIIAGGASYLVGAIYDIATADNAARSWNKRHGYGVAPIAIVDSHGTGAGLALEGNF